MKPYISRTDNLPALRKLVHPEEGKEQGYHLTPEDYFELLQHGAWKCALWILPYQPELARVRDTYTGITPLHVVASEFAGTFKDCEQWVATLVACGASMQERDTRDLKPIQYVWRERRSTNSKVVAWLSHLFIDYGAWPIQGHQTTLADWEHRIRAFKGRIATQAALMYVFSRRLKPRLPRDLALLLVRHQVLMGVHAWRKWK